MNAYAERTRVPVAQSRAEIEKILTRYGADQFMSGWHEKGAVIAFRANGRHIRFFLPLPASDSRNAEQVTRQQWRALVLMIKSKLAAVTSGITYFEDEFLAHIVLPDGQSVGQWLKPQLRAVYDKGSMPPLLPAPEGR